jgi:hypothetical protein
MTVFNDIAWHQMRIKMLPPHLIASSSPQSFLTGKSEDKGGLITPLCSRLTTHNSRFFIHVEPAQHRPSN